MKYTKDMLLESDSGFMMPFELEKDDTVPIILDFGQQTHPQTGETFFHRGMDFAISDVPLFAIASGTVKGCGDEGIHGKFIIVSYGEYEVEYGHLARYDCKYGTIVKAGDIIAQAGTFLHLGVRFHAKDIHPFEFLDMIFSNIKNLASCKKNHTPFIDEFGVIISSSYDEDMEEIEKMMARWLPSYYGEINNGTFASSKRISESLRQLLQQAAEENLYYEVLPSVSNPLGLSKKGVRVASKMVDLMIEDFLAFVVLRHNHYVDTWDKDRRKSFANQMVKDGYIIDPLANMYAEIKSYDIQREASIYYDTTGQRVWTKAWFNGREKGEASIEITRDMAIKFTNNEITRDVWLSRYYPKQMQNVKKAVAEARMQAFGVKQ